MSLKHCVLYGCDGEPFGFQHGGLVFEMFAGEQTLAEFAEESIFPDYDAEWEKILADIGYGVEELAEDLDYEVKNLFDANVMVELYDALLTTLASYVEENR